MRTVLILLASVATASAQALPVPKVGSCPSGYPESGGFCAPMRRDARCPSSRMQSASYCLEGAAKAEELALPATQLGQWVRTGVPSSSSISVVEWLTP